MSNQHTGPPRLADCDEWAVKVAITEGVRVNLSDDELLLAVAVLRQRDFNEEQIAERLRISQQKAHATVRRYYRWRRLFVAQVVIPCH